MAIVALASTRRPSRPARSCLAPRHRESSLVSPTRLRGDPRSQPAFTHSSKQHQPPTMVGLSPRPANHELGRCRNPRRLDSQRSRQAIAGRCTNASNRRTERLLPNLRPPTNQRSLCNRSERMDVLLATRTQTEPLLDLAGCTPGLSRTRRRLGTLGRTLAILPVDHPTQRYPPVHPLPGQTTGPSK